MHLIPTVQYYETIGNDFFLFNDQVQILFSPLLIAAAQYLALSLKLCNLIPLTQNSSKKIENSIILKVLSETTKSAEFPNESYQIEITKGSIILEAAEMTGLMHAIHTLLQLLDTSYQIPCMIIKDEPAFKWRGCLLDSSRHFQSKDFILKFIKMLAYHKLNRFHWHLVDDQGWRIESKLFPKLTEIGSYRKEEDGKLYGGFYSQEDIKEIVDYANLLKVIIVPEIELPGHCSSVLAAYPEYGCTEQPLEVPSTWGIFRNVFCAGKDSTFKFLEKVLEEIVSLFPNSPFIHIGGDECLKDHWKQCQKCQKRIRDLNLRNEEELQSWFIKKIGEILHRLNKKMIGWDEILEGGLAPDAIVQPWRSFEGGYLAAIQRHYTIMSPTSHCYFDYALPVTDIKQVYSFDPIPVGLPKDFHSFILGGEGCMWTERAPEKLVMGKVYPRLLALSTIFWSYQSKPGFEQFMNTLREYHLPRLKKYDIGNLVLVMKECSDGLIQKPNTRYPCRIETTMGVYANYYPEFAFDNDLGSHYWSNRGLREADLFTIYFEPHLKGSNWKLTIHTGKVFEEDRDVLEYGQVEILSEKDGWLTIGKVIKGKGKFQFSALLLKAVRLRVLKQQNSWLCIRDLNLEPDLKQ